MPGARKRLQLAALIVLIVIADQWTKSLARETLSDLPQHYAGGVLTFLLTENEGAFLSLGAHLPASARMALFAVAVSIAVIVALFLLLTSRVRGLDAMAVAMIAGGGIGNLIDRLVRHGRVTDFLLLSAGPLHTGIFNVADMAITGGVIWLLVSSFLPKRPAM
jgi:signal peptidase II